MEMMGFFLFLVGVVAVVGTGFRAIGDMDWTVAMIFGLLAAGLCWATVDAWREPIIGLLDSWRHRHDR